VIADRCKGNQDGAGSGEREDPPGEMDVIVVNGKPRRQKHGRNRSCQEESQQYGYKRKPGDTLGEIIKLLVIAKLALTILHLLKW